MRNQKKSRPAANGSGSNSSSNSADNKLNTEFSQRASYDRFRAGTLYFEKWICCPSDNLDANSLAMIAHTACQVWKNLADEELCESIVVLLLALRQTALGYLKIERAQTDLDMAVANFWNRAHASQENA